MRGTLAAEEEDPNKRSSIFLSLVGRSVFYLHGHCSSSQNHQEILWPTYRLFSMMMTYMITMWFPRCFSPAHSHHHHRSRRLKECFNLDLEYLPRYLLVP